MRYASLLVFLAVLASQCGACGSPAAARTLPDEVLCLDWPLGPDHRYVSTAFHDPAYGYKKEIGEHWAIDLPAEVGTPVLASAAGKVVVVEPVKAGAASFVIVRFDRQWTYGVMHLSRIDVVRGQPIARGDQLGLSGGAVDAPGSGPYTSGPHLHFSLAYPAPAEYVDPAPYLCP